jgi:hypothetical protein
MLEEVVKLATTDVSPKIIEMNLEADTIVNLTEKNMNLFEEMVDHIVEHDFEIEEVNSSQEEATIKCNNMSFIKQYTKDASDEEVKKNQASGWSNPTLSEGLTLDEEAVIYKETRLEIDRIIEEKGDEIFVPDALSYKLDRTFKKIAGYYANYENKWYNEMKGIFPERESFVHFYYDLIMECLMGFDVKRESTEIYENDFRKSKGKQCHFNQYWIGAITKRKITEIKKRSSTKRNPNIVCQVCGESVGKITGFHLKHRYDEQRISKEFGVKPISVTIEGKKVKIYETCPITGEKNFPLSRIKEHTYAPSMTVEEYLHEHPSAPLSGSVCSLQTPIGGAEDGDGRTLEDVYHDSAASSGNEHRDAIFEEHIDHVFIDNPEMASILKLKMKNYKNSEIAEIVGEENTFYCPIEDGTQDMIKKSDISAYFHSNKELLGAEEYLSKHRNFYILSREVVGTDDVQWEAITVTSCSPNRVNQVVTKLRDDLPKIRELFDGRKF